MLQNGEKMIFSTDAALLAGLLSITVLFLTHNLGHTFDLLSYQHSLVMTKITGEQIVRMLLFSEKDWICHYGDVYLPACVWVKPATVIRSEIVPGNFKCELYCSGPKAIEFEAFVGCNDGTPSYDTPVYTIPFKVCLADNGEDPYNCVWHDCNLEVWR